MPAKKPTKAPTKAAPARASAAATKAPAKKATTPSGGSTRPAGAKASKASKATAKGPAAAKNATATKAAAPARSAAARKSATASKAATAKGAAAATGGAPARRPARRSAALDKFFESQRITLVEERATYTRQAESLRAEADLLAAEREPGDVQFDEESGEGDTLAVERERDLALSAEAQASVEDIDRALAKIEDGSYGTCEQCGEAIPRTPPGVAVRIPVRPVQERGPGAPLTPGPMPADPVATGRPTRPTALVLAVAAAVVVVDQLTKWWAVEALDDRSVDLLWTLRFRLVFNTGSAFSFGAGRGGLIGLVAVGVVLVMLWLSRSVDNRRGAVGLGLVLGGAIGNLADRAFRAGGEGFLSGAVVDFVDLQWWPVFNVADAAIVIGAVLLVVTGAGRRVGHAPGPPVAAGGPPP